MKNMSNTNVGGQTDPVLDRSNVQEESTENAQTRTDVGSSHSPKARCMLVAVADMNHDYYIKILPTILRTVQRSMTRRPVN